MAVGEKRKLTIQPKLGYGSRAMGDAIPANSVLSKFRYLAYVYQRYRLLTVPKVFETELVNIQGVSKNEL